jgi:hypothetical protein
MQTSKLLGVRITIDVELTDLRSMVNNEAKSIFTEKGYTCSGVGSSRFNSARKVSVHKSGSNNSILRAISSGSSRLTLFIRISGKVRGHVSVTTTLIFCLNTDQHSFSFEGRGRS